MLESPLPIGSELRGNQRSCPGLARPFVSETDSCLLTCGFLSEPDPVRLDPFHQIHGSQMSKPRSALFPILAVIVALIALSFPLLKLLIDVRSLADTARITADVLHVLVAMALAAVACVTLIGGRYSSLSFALYAFALSRAAQPAGLWKAFLPGGWSWVGTLLAALVAGASAYGFLRLCMRTPSGAAMGRWRSVDRFIPAYALLLGMLYGAGLSANHFYVAFGILIWIGYAVGLLAYLDRRRTAVGEELLRTRWVALAIAAHVAIEAVFLALNMLGHAQFAAYVFMLNPAPYAFAYALVRGRIVDVRVFGGRALVYAAITSVPIAVLAVLELLFEKELRNVRLAGFVEVTVAVAFSFWLQSLHRRIDRFVERWFFAQRHHAHAAIEKMIDALPFVEQPDTIETMLGRDVPEQLGFQCAAIYGDQDGGFSLRTSSGCSGLASHLDRDDPLILYPRSNRTLVALCDIPASRILLPAGELIPAYALPIIGGGHTFAIVLYGEHRTGEPMDSEEERLLVRLAHGAANAYEHLLLRTRESEIAALRHQLGLS